MSTGQEALAEAARLEAARVYTRTVREDREVPALYAPPARKLVDVGVIRQALSDGAGVSEVMQRYGASYELVRSVRLSMRGAA